MPLTPASADPTSTPEKTEGGEQHARSRFATKEEFRRSYAKEKPRWAKLADRLKFPHPNTSSPTFRLTILSK